MLSSDIAHGSIARKGLGERCAVALASDARRSLASVRAMFFIYLVAIMAGLAYFATIGLLHR
jgi:hypothetical protein